MADKHYGILIHPDTTIELVNTPGGADEIHRLVGGYFENVYLWSTFRCDVVMSVDEQGKLKGKPVNILATKIYNNLYDFIVGDALILKLERVGELQKLDQVPFTYHQAQIVKQFCEMILAKIPKEDLDIVLDYVKNSIPETPAVKPENKQ